MNCRTFALALLLATPAAAQPDVTYTPSAGVFPVKAQTAPADPDAMPTASVSVVAESDGSPLACADAGPDTVVTIPTTVPLASLPMLVKAKGWTAPGCTGEETALSPNQGTIKLGLPEPPVLVP